MKRFLFFATLLMVMSQAYAADVDLARAQATAHHYLNKVAPGKRLAGQPATSVKLLYTEVNSSRATQAVYYIFNSGRALARRRGSCFCAIFKFAHL